MKKILLIAFLGSIFAAGTAFGHCGTCGVGDEKAHDHAKVECKAGCDKADCASKTDCKEACTKPCCAKKADCKEDCTKPCCAKKTDETAAAPKAAGSCCASKAGAPA